MKNHNQFVRCVENIQDLSGQKLYEYGLILGGGGFFSRKTIKYDPKTKKYAVRNHIDYSREVLTERMFKKLYAKAMKHRCLIASIA